MRLVKENKAVLFLGGFLLGFLLMNMGKSILLTGTGMFDEDTLYHMRYMAVDSGALFCYVLRKRFLRMSGLILLLTTYLGALACAVMIAWYGLYSGRFFVYPVTAVWNQRIFDCPGGHISPIYFLCASDIAVIAVGGQGSCRNPGGVEKKVSAFTDTGAASAGMFIGRICKSGNIA